jgi:hypothetical protein
MSYTKQDAWLDVRDDSDWAFNHWGLQFPLREGHRYLDWYGVPHTHGPLFHRLLAGLGKADLAESLRVAAETVAYAIDHSQADAAESWFKHEVWLPVIDERLRGDTDPAQLVIESIDLLGPPDELEEKALVAGVGLWCLGEYVWHEKRGRVHEAITFSVQAGIAAAEVAWYLGMEKEARAREAGLSKRNTAANDIRHAANRQRKADAAEWFQESGDRRGTASRMAKRFNIGIDSARQWIREFKRAAEKQGLPLEKRVPPAQT